MRWRRAAHKVDRLRLAPLAETEAATEEPAAGFHFEGLLACEDPVREGVAEAIAACAEAGIHTILVTGDHPLTARAVAREIGLGGAEPRVLSGEGLDAFLARARQRCRARST